MQFRRKRKEMARKKMAAAAEEEVFPYELQTMSVYHYKDPIVLGVEVIDGIVKVGAPVCVRQTAYDCMDIGRIASIQDDDQNPLDSANQGQRVSIKIIGTNPEERKKMFGRHFGYRTSLGSRWYHTQTKLN